VQEIGKSTALNGVLLQRGLPVKQEIWLALH